MKNCYSTCIVAIFYAFVYYTGVMNTVKKDINTRELSIIERSTRNSIIWRLSCVGFNVSSIANIMNMTQSTVSRMIDKKPSRSKVIDTVLFGDKLGE
jgi:DNA-binding MarR family transcriptional regulator